MYFYGNVTYIGHFAEAPETAGRGAAESCPDVFDIPGLVRRVRRTRDLSQRDLAAALGVDHSLVARWETGQREPRLGLFQKLLDLADVHLEVRDTTAETVPPMRPDAIRDGGGRRIPAHLDVYAFIGAPPVPLPVGAEEREWCVPHRPARDYMRARIGQPPASDHPTHSQLVATLAAAKAVRAKARFDLIAAHQAARAAAEDPFEAWLAEPCTCPARCFDLPGCADECRCRCEDPRSGPPGREGPPT